MKKISILLFAVMSLCVAAIGFAAADNATNETNAANAKTNAGYYSTKHPQHSKLKAATPGTQFPPMTDITIYNGTNNFIFAIVPNTPVIDMILPGEVDHIYHDTKFEPTYLVLQDFYHRTFFERYVCRSAMITVNAPDYSAIRVIC